MFIRHEDGSITVGKVKEGPIGVEQSAPTDKPEETPTPKKPSKKKSK